MPQYALRVERGEDDGAWRTNATTFTTTTVLSVGGTSAWNVFLSFDRPTNPPPDTRFGVRDARLKLVMAAVGPSVAQPMTVRLATPGQSVPTTHAAAQALTYLTPSATWTLHNQTLNEIVESPDLAELVAAWHEAVGLLTQAPAYLFVLQWGTTAAQSAPTIYSHDSSLLVRPSFDWSVQQPLVTPFSGTRYTPLADSLDVPDPPASSDLPWLTTQGDRIVDEAGREVLLRGAVTITHYNDGTALDYTSADYERMAEAGISVQAIRVYARAIGAADGYPVDEDYLTQLDTMITRAAEAGIYTMLKLTIYDTRGGTIEGWFTDARWAQFWNTPAEQEEWLDGWEALWETYKDNPAVVGYDLLNEPKQGSLGLSTAEFEAEHLAPFYQQAVNRLREIDRRHLALVQPALVSFDAGTDTVQYGTLAGQVEGDHLVYAPHMYIELASYRIAPYTSAMAALVDQARRLGMPLFVGEFGKPWDPADDGNATLLDQALLVEREAHKRFDWARVGYARPWWADDRSGDGLNVKMALFPGSSGIGGAPRSWLYDPLVSPYPVRTAGRLAYLRWTFSLSTLTMTYDARPLNGPTELAIPYAYASGFNVARSDGVSVDIPASGALPVLPLGWRWDADRHRLEISEQRNARYTLTVTPL
ncbi:MAG: cellulase family glycosylhydrolase [Ardenticatenales bacterium]|nr:cellulase family glycosylhydrolase [Ardenticatenales bacterium]